MLGKCLEYEENGTFMKCMSQVSGKFEGRFEELKKMIVLLRRATISELIQI